MITVTEIFRTEIEGWGLCRVVMLPSGEVDAQHFKDNKSWEWILPPFPTPSSYADLLKAGIKHLYESKK